MSSRMPMLCKEVLENSWAFMPKMHNVVFETRKNTRQKTYIANFTHKRANSKIFDKTWLTVKILGIVEAFTFMLLIFLFNFKIN